MASDSAGMPRKILATIAIIATIIPTKTNFDRKLKSFFVISENAESDTKIPAVPAKERVTIDPLPIAI